MAVVIPAYNRADLLPRALASVRAQSMPLAEVIVVDDHSTDDTAAVARESGARVIEHESNRGESAARNTGIAATTQPWIALLDSDDEWTRSHLEHAFGLRETHALVAASALRSGPAPGERRIHGVEGRKPVVLRSPASAAYPVNRIPLSSVILSRDAVIEVGGFDPELRLCADLDLWIRMLETGTAFLSPAVGSIYHYHPGQISVDADEMQQAYLEVLARYSSLPWLSQSFLRRCEGVAEWSSVRRAIRERRPMVAARAFGRVLRYPMRVIGAARIQTFWLRMRGRTLRLNR